jgi:hypothetical protein
MAQNLEKYLLVNKSSGSFNVIQKCIFYSRLQEGVSVTKYFYVFRELDSAEQDFFGGFI